MTTCYYVPQPLPPGCPDWIKQQLQDVIDVVNDSIRLRRDWFGLPPFWVDPQIAQLHPLVITDGKARQ